MLLIFKCRLLLGLRLIHQYHQVIHVSFDHNYNTLDVLFFFSLSFFTQSVQYTSAPQYGSSSSTAIVVSQVSHFCKSKTFGFLQQRYGNGDIVLSYSGFVCPQAIQIVSNLGYLAQMPIILAKFFILGITHLKTWSSFLILQRMC